MDGSVDRPPEGPDPARYLEELRESEARLRRLSDATSEGIAIHERGHILEVNAAFADLVRVRPSELIGTSALDLVPPQWHGAFAEYLFSASEEAVEMQIGRRDGTTFDAELVALPIPFHGRPAARVLRVRDVTERKRAEEGLRRREAILEAVAFAAECLLAAPSWYEAIQDVLQRLGLSAGVSRVYVFENHEAPEGRLLQSQRFEWTAPGIAPQLDNPDLQEESFEDAGLGDWMETLAAGGVVHGEVSGFSQAKQRLLEPQDIRSLAIVPIFVRQRWWGSIGFDECTRDREWTPAEIEALRAAAGAIGAAIGRTRAERELMEAQAKYRTLIEQIPAAVYLAEFGVDGDWLYMSPQIERIMGYTPDEWLAHPHPQASFTHPDDLPRVREAERVAFESDEPLASEYRMQTRDGRWIWMRDEASVVRDDAGRPLFMQGILADITEERRTVSERLEAEARFRTLVEQIPAITYIESVDKLTGLVDATVYLSPQTTVLVGYTPEEWTTPGFFWDHIIHPEDRDQVREAARASERNGGVWRGEYRVVTRDGRVRRFRDEAHLIHDELGTPRFWQGIIVDVTEEVPSPA